MAGKIDEGLLEFLEEEIAREKLPKQAKFKGIITGKKLTSNDNIILVIMEGKSEEAVLVNKDMNEMFQLASQLQLNDEVYIRGPRSVSVVLCDELQRC